MRKKGRLHLLSVALMLLFCLAACQNDSGLKQNKDGAWEIHTAEDLILMTAKAGEGESFLLMRDIDMNGSEWTPVEDFKGVFDGQSYTISNLTITKSSADGSMGFFAVIGYCENEDGTVVSSEVKNLHLNNVNIVATEESRYVGLLAGRTYGSIRNCTTVGTVTDSRTMLTKAVYIGAIAGSVENGKASGNICYTEDYEGYLIGGAGTACVLDQVKGLSSKMARFFATLEEGSENRVFGVAGIAAEGQVDSAAIWQDTSNSTEYASAVLQERRRTVVDYMYQMATVKWTPYSDMTYYSYGSGSHTTPDWYKGTIYSGIPYTHGNCSLERFLSALDEPVGGCYTMKSTIPAVGYYYEDSAVIAEVNIALREGKTLTPSGYYVPETAEGEFGYQHQAGFATYIGNDCNTAVMQAWRTVTAVTGTDGTKARGGGDLLPVNYNITTYNIVPVNELRVDNPISLAKTQYKRQALEDTFNRDPAAFYEALACTCMGDGLYGCGPSGGHTRLAAGDAVVIRDYMGEILPKASYIVAHEQGRPSTVNGYKSDWTVNYRYTFDMLTNYSSPEYLDENGKSMIGVRGVYVPATIAALREEDTPAATPYVEFVRGAVRSNFNILSTTVGEETVFNGVVQSGHTGTFHTVNLETVHKNIKKDDTVKVLLSNGEIFEIVYE